jgi:putative phosphoribosyl transferase
MFRPFHNRSEAGRLLARELERYHGRPDVIVLGLPRGGVPVAFEVARGLGVPLDVLPVRKLGVPGYEELAMGAVAFGGRVALNQDVILELAVPRRLLDEAVERERRELERREQAYRGSRAPPEVKGHTVILVDDGAATGATIRAAVMATRAMNADRIIVAVPAAAVSTKTVLESEADEVVCLATPDPFYAVGMCYDEFPQLSDAEVQHMLARAGEVDDESARAARPL